MSGPDWYRWYPSKWLAGTVGLTNEQRGVYIQIINVIYDRGACPVDETYLKSLCNCHLRVLRRVIRELLALDKIQRVGQNYEQTRAKLERKESETFIKTQRNRALKRWHNNDLDHANAGNANHNHNHNHNKKDNNSPEPKPLPAPNGADDPRYVFKGVIVRVNQADYAQWQKSYPLVDLTPELQRLDDFYVTLPKKELGNWFSRCSAALAKMQKEATALKAQRSPQRRRGHTADDLMSYTGEDHPYGRH